MQTLPELGEVVARRRLGLKQGDVAVQAGIAQATLYRFKLGKLPEFGSRKLLAVLAVPGMELQFGETDFFGSLDPLRRERNPRLIKTLLRSL